jgi:DNA-3-methyladenine glycosylase II
MTENRQRMTRKTLAAGAGILARRDSVLAGLLDEFGVPPLWQRTQSLRTLVFIILEQKVSLSSARAVMKRLDALCPNFTPLAFLALDTIELRNIGFSAAKVGYCQSIAQAIDSGALNLAALRSQAETNVRDTLLRVHGVGPWTAGVYIMMAMGRRDAWASGDRALAVSVFESWQLTDVPAYAELDAMAAAWQPWRGVASRLLWHAYLSRRR